MMGAVALKEPTAVSPARRRSTLSTRSPMSCASASRASSSPASGSSGRRGRSRRSSILDSGFLPWVLWP